MPGALVIWRDSVAAGDDADAPHEWRLPAGTDASVAEVVRRITAPGYLASVSGGRATWIIDAERPLAVVAQQWPEPHFLDSPDESIWNVVNHSARPHIQARYWCQVDPSRVFDCLRAGEPLPDKYSGG